jgi:hypothetical protein
MHQLERIMKEYYGSRKLNGLTASLSLQQAIKCSSTVTIKKLPSNRPRRATAVLPVKYELHVHIKKVNLSPYQAVEAHSCASCEVRTSCAYKMSKFIPVTGRGGL